VKPTISTPKLEPLRRKAALRGALAIFRLVHRRAFPDAGTRAKNRDGSKVKKLSRNYMLYKSGLRRYKSAGTKKAADTVRAKNGPGRGPWVDGRRLGVRKPIADAQLTSKTGNQFGVVHKNASGVTVGFRTARARTVALALQDRNKMLPPSEKEVEAGKEAARAVLGKWFKGIHVSGGGTIHL